MDLLLVMAVLPAAWLLRYVYRLDPIEKEPPRLLAVLLLLGALSCIPAVILESIGIDGVMGGVEPTTYGQLIFENFFVIALSEELCKMVFLRLKTWRSPQFNYVFDGIVYAVFVSLGFAILENIGYVFSFGMGTAVVRAVTAIPGHAIFGVFMGCFYGLEKMASVEGERGKRWGFAVLSLLVPVFCHGFYDFCASVESEAFLVVFFVFLIAMVVVASRLVKWMAKMAHPIGAGGQVGVVVPQQVSWQQVQHPGQVQVYQPAPPAELPQAQPSSPQTVPPQAQQSTPQTVPPHTQQPGYVTQPSGVPDDAYWGSNQVPVHTYTLHW